MLILPLKKKIPVCDEEKIKKKMENKTNNPELLAKTLAKEKAKSIGVKYPQTLVVGCDTIIVFQNKVFNKAINLKDAFFKINMLSGKKHKILSAISVFYKNKQIWSCCQSSTVKFRALNHKEIKEYLNKTGSKILNSVGCYQVEKMGPNIIESIQGDFFNVMGFPLFKFLNFLIKHKHPK